MAVPSPARIAIPIPREYAQEPSLRKRKEFTPSALNVKRLISRKEISRQFPKDQRAAFTHLGAWARLRGLHIRRCFRHGRGPAGRRNFGAFDFAVNLAELAGVQPYAGTLRALVNFHSL